MIRRPIVGIHGNGHWAPVNSCLQSIAVALRNISIAIGARILTRSREWALAFLVNGMVWVGRLESDAVYLNILEGIVHPATIAALVALSTRAVDQLLLSE